MALKVNNARLGSSVSAIFFESGGFYAKESRQARAIHLFTIFYYGVIFHVCLRT